jgi:hypothetical protein
MTRSEYRELVEFLSKKFNAIDGRFEGIEGRLARVEVGLERYRHQTEVVAEGVTALRNEMQRGFNSVWDELRGLSGRMDRWEARTL